MPAWKEITGREARRPSPMRSSSHRVAKDPGGGWMRIRGTSTESESAGFAVSGVERREAALILDVRLGAFRQEKLHDLVVALQRRAVKRRLAAAVHGVDVHAAFEADLDRFNRVAFGFLAADGVFFFRAQARGQTALY